MKRIIFDCDNTFGVKGCDVDDGLALLYLLGCDDADIVGITTTYGNNKIDVVYPNTLSMLKTIGRNDIYVGKGGASAGDYSSEASSYLAQTINRYPGEISILATGSLTNLYGAYTIDNHFFNKVKNIVLMGGITEPLIFAKRSMDELNFSCDSLAAFTVLTKGKNVSVITGNNCLQALFTREEYQKELFTSKEKIAGYIREETDYWFDDNKDVYGIKGFYNWDVTAAVYLMHPELYEDNIQPYDISKDDLKTGFLKKKQGNCILNLPEIKDEKRFRKSIYSSWLSVKI